MPNPWTPEEHRAEAERWLAELGSTRTGSVHSPDERTNAAASVALAHAMLAGPETIALEPAELRSTASLGWSGVFVLLLIAAVILGVAFLVTR